MIKKMEKCRKCKMPADNDKAYWSICKTMCKSCCDKLDCETCFNRDRYNGR